MKSYLLIFCVVNFLVMNMEIKGKTYYPEITKFVNDTSKKHTDTVKHVKITRVVLSAPPGAHFFGEGFRLVSLSAIEQTGSDTIKIKETIQYYKLSDKEAIFYFGDNYPNQKLTVLIKGQAKLLLDAILVTHYHNGDSAIVLNGKKLFAYGRVSHLMGKPRIVIKNPDLFVIVD